MTITVPCYYGSEQYPSMKEAWVAQLLNVQRVTKAEIKLRAVPADTSELEDEYREPIKDFVTKLQKELTRMRRLGHVVIDILSDSEK